jgi:hypothetical protein
MLNRSTRDEMQNPGVLYRFAQSLHLVPRDDDSAPATPPPAAKPAPPATGIAGAAQKLAGRQTAIDKAVDEGSQ